MKTEITRLFTQINTLNINYMSVLKMTPLIWQRTKCKNIVLEINIMLLLGFVIGSFIMNMNSLKFITQRVYRTIYKSMSSQYLNGLFRQDVAT